MSSNPRRPAIKRVFKVGDHVTWNSEAGHVSGTIIKVHTTDVNYKGYTHHASEAEPQYEIKSDKTDHIASWLKHHPWFERRLVPVLRARINALLRGSPTLAEPAR
jgi:hypothetical protein